MLRRLLALRPRPTGAGRLASPQPLRVCQGRGSGSGSILPPLGGALALGAGKGARSLSTDGASRPPGPPASGSPSEATFPPLSTPETPNHPPSERALDALTLERLPDMLDEGKTKDVVGLLARHTGPLDPAVCLKLLTRLHERQEYLLILRSFHMMNRSKVPLSPEAAAIVLDALAFLSSRNRNSFRSERLAEGRTILSGLERTAGSASLAHHNAMLRLCLSCVEVGGINLAVNLYTRMLERDVNTYATMLRITARRANEREFALALRIYKDIQLSSLPMDDYLLSALLMNCIRYRSETSMAFGNELLQRYLGFIPPPAVDASTVAAATSVSATPLTTPTSSTAAAMASESPPSPPPPTPMTLLLLLRCIHFLSLSPSPLLAHRFAQLHMNTPGLSTEATACNFQAWKHLLSVLVRTGELEEAWTLVSTRVPDAFKYETSLRLVAAALWANHKQGRTEGNAMWLDRAAAYTSLRPAHASVPLLTDYVKVVMGNPDQEVGEAMAFIVDHYLPDLQGAERKLASILRRLQAADPKDPVLRHDFLALTQINHLLTFLARLVGRARQSLRGSHHVASPDASAHMAESAPADLEAALPTSARLRHQRRALHVLEAFVDRNLVSQGFPPRFPSGLLQGEGEEANASGEEEVDEGGRSI